MAGMDHSKMNMPAEPAAKAPAATAGGMVGMDHSKMGQSMAGMETAAPAGDVPVCKTPADPKTAPKTDYKGKTYYFCSESDRQKFLANPAKYLKDNLK
jgi:YHS domain-containing protein